jgi:cysteine-rich repeat protein
MLGYYACDDGNFINGDGCTSTCTVEQCWTCNGLSPTVCKIDPVNTIGLKNATISID